VIYDGEVCLGGGVIDAAGTQSFVAAASEASPSHGPVLG
jgi:hypothetical protein